MTIAIPRYSLVSLKFLFLQLSRFKIFVSFVFPEVVTTGSPQTLISWQVLHWNRTYGGFVDAVCDKAFVVPCWIALLNSVPASGSLRIAQYITLIFLILAEVARGCIRFRAYFSSVAVPAPKVEGFNFSTSAVKVRHAQYLLKV